MLILIPTPTFGVFFCANVMYLFLRFKEDFFFYLRNCQITDFISRWSLRKSRTLEKSLVPQRGIHRSISPLLELITENKEDFVLIINVSSCLRPMVQKSDKCYVNS